MIERADEFSLDYSLVAVAIEACLTCTYNLYVCFDFLQHSLQCSFTLLQLSDSVSRISLTAGVTRSRHLQRAWWFMLVTQPQDAARALEGPALISISPYFTLFLNLFWPCLTKSQRQRLLMGIRYVNSLMGKSANVGCCLKGCVGLDFGFDVHCLAELHSEIGWSDSGAPSCYKVCSYGVRSWATCVLLRLHQAISFTNKLGTAVPLHIFAASPNTIWFRFGPSECSSKSTA